MKEREPKRYFCRECATLSCPLRNMKFCPPNCTDFVPLPTAAKQESSDEYQSHRGPDAVVVKVKRPPVRGIWASSYVCKLGIQDHCIEVLEAMDELRARKLVTNSRAPIRDTMEKNLEQEVMDLHIILEAWAADRGSLYDARRSLFEKKASAEATA